MKFFIFLGILCIFCLGQGNSCADFVPNCSHLDCGQPETLSFCLRTCGHCLPAGPGDVHGCADSEPDCATLDIADCVHPDVTERCKMTCGQCPSPNKPGSLCEDMDLCEPLMHLCDMDPDVAERCPKTCGRC